MSVTDLPYLCLQEWLPELVAWTYWISMPNRHHPAAAQAAIWRRVASRTAWLGLHVPEGLEACDSAGNAWTWGVEKHRRRSWLLGIKIAWLLLITHFTWKKIRSNMWGDWMIKTQHQQHKMGIMIWIFYFGVHRHTYIGAYVHTGMHTCAHKQARTCMHEYRYTTHPYIHIRTFVHDSMIYSFRHTCIICMHVYI